VCDLKNAWIIAEKYHDEAQHAGETCYNFVKSENWLGFLAEIRTFFKENPQPDFYKIERPSIYTLIILYAFSVPGSKCSRGGKGVRGGFRPVLPRSSFANLLGCIL